MLTAERLRCSGDSRSMTPLPAMRVSVHCAATLRRTNAGGRGTSNTLIGHESLMLVLALIGDR